MSFLRDGKYGEALLAYCEEEERWTISLPSVNVIPTKDGKKCEDNPCNKYDPCNWIAASSVSQDFDVLTTTDSQWIVRNGPERISSLSQHFLYHVMIAFTLMTFAEKMKSLENVALIVGRSNGIVGAPK